MVQSSRAAHRLKKHPDPDRNERWVCALHRMGAGPDPGSGSRGNVSHTYSGRQRNKSNTKNAESMSNQIRCGRNASRNVHNCNNKIDSQGIIFGETVQLVNQMKIFGLEILQAFSGKQIEYKNSDVNKHAPLSVAK